MLPSALEEARARQEEIKPQRRDSAHRAGEAARKHRERAAELTALEASGSLISPKAADRRLTIARGAEVPEEAWVKLNEGEQAAPIVLGTSAPRAMARRRSAAFGGIREPEASRAVSSAARSRCLRRLPGPVCRVAPLGLDLLLPRPGFFKRRREHVPQCGA